MCVINLCTKLKIVRWRSIPLTIFVFRPVSVICPLSKPTGSVCMIFLVLYSVVSIDRKYTQNSTPEPVSYTVYKASSEQMSYHYLCTACCMCAVQVACTLVHAVATCTQAQEESRFNTILSIIFLLFKIIYVYLYYMCIYIQYTQIHIHKTIDLHSLYI